MKKDYHRFLKILEKYDTGLCTAAKATLQQLWEENIVMQTTATVSAPLVFGFMWWTIQEAQKKGIKRLYFLARDGYVMYEMAQIICEHFKLEIECRYLYCSRIAWRLPQYHIQKEACLDKICLMGIDVTLEKILDRGSLKESEKQIIYRELGVEDGEEKIILSKLEIEEYKKKLRDSICFLKMVYAHSYEAYENTIGYLEQMGLFEEISYAVVDTGWTGSMQESLEQLLASKTGKDKKVKGFYFGVYNYPQTIKAENISGFFFNKGTNKKRKVFFNNCLFECMCGAADGMTTGYKFEGSEYRPIFSSDKNINLEKWDLEKQIHTMICFAKNAVSKIDYNQYKHSNNLELNHRLCKAFMSYPSKEEAECYGNYVFSDDVTEKDVKKIAIEMESQEIQQNHVIPKMLVSFGLKKMSKQYKQTCWLEGTIARSSIGGKGYHQLNAIVYKWMLYTIQ